MDSEIEKLKSLLKAYDAAHPFLEEEASKEKARRKDALAEVEILKPDGTYATPEEIKQLRDEGVLTTHRPLVISRGEEFEKMMRDSGHWNDPVAIREALVDGRDYSYEGFSPEQQSACEDRTVILTGRLNQIRLEVVRGIVEDGVAHIYGIGAPQCRAVVETDESGAVRIGVSRD